MRLTTKGRFAVTAMIDLAQQQGEGPVGLAGISERQDISLSYLEQLFGKLRRYNLVESVRGPGGGCRLRFRSWRLNSLFVLGGVARQQVASTGISVSGPRPEPEQDIHRHPQASTGNAGSK